MHVLFIHQNYPAQFGHIAGYLAQRHGFRCSFLSWSLLDALACGTTVLASDTAPVREVIEDGKTGLLRDFFDVDGLADLAGQVLDAPQDYKHLGRAGIELVRQRYTLEVCLPRMMALYEDAVYEHRHG